MKKKIIAVDNNPVILKLLSSFLKEEGHKVITAEDGIFAIDILRTFVPDIMFIDLIMPNINGDKLCQIIRNNPKYKDIFIIIFSGIAVEDDTGLNFLEFGANACLAKGPFGSLKDDIRDLIKQAEGTKSKEAPNKVIGIERLYRREITRELLDAKKHADVMLDNFSDAVFELTAEGLIVNANPKAVVLAGEKENKLLAREFFDLFHEGHSSLVRNSFNLALREKCVENSCPSVGMNGTEISLQFIPIQSEAMLSVLVVAHNISESRKDLMMLKETNDFVVSECQFIKQYVSGISRVVEKTGSELALLLGKKGGSVQSQEFDKTTRIPQIEKTADNLNIIAKELGNFAELKLLLSNYAPSMFDLEKVFAEGTVGLRKKAAAKKIDLSIDLPELKNTKLIGTPEGMLDVAVGLAAMFLDISDTGKLSIRGEIVGGPNVDAGKIKCLFSLWNSNFYFPTDSKNIFDFLLPATLFSGQYAPSLGKKLINILHEVRKLGGELWVEKHSEGCPAIFFTACFDACSETGKGSGDFRQIVEGEYALFSQKWSILFLDDDVFTSEFLVDTIEQLTSWQAIVTDDLSELSIAIGKHNFDLVVVNVDMASPEITDAANIVRSKLQRQDLPVIALTEETQEEQDKFREEGFDDCISKPVDIDDFFSVIKKHLKRSLRKSNELKTSVMYLH